MSPFLRNFDRLSIIFIFVSLSQPPITTLFESENELFKSLFKNLITSLSIIFFGETPNFFAFSFTSIWLPNLLSIDINFNFGLNLRASKPIVPLPDPISNKVPNSGNSKSASICILTSLFVNKFGLSSNVLKVLSLIPKRGIPWIL